MSEKIFAAVKANFKELIPIVAVMQKKLKPQHPQELGRDHDRSS